MRIKKVVPTIAYLLMLSFPPAIVWTVSFGAVNSVQGVANAGCFSHVGKKSIKRFTPTSTDRDSLCPVVSEIVGFGITAAGNHLGPNLVLSRFRFAVQSAGDVIASAGTIAIAPKMIGANASVFTAIAQADPAGMRIIGYIPLNCNQTAEALSGQVLQLTTGTDTIVISHDVFLLVKGRVEVRALRHDECRGARSLYRQNGLVQV